MKKMEIKNLSKKINGTIVLESINLTFKLGKIYGIRGKNGCGKTMLFRALVGLILPTSGTIEIDGKVLHKDMDVLDSVGVLIETPAFMMNCTGIDNLMNYARLKEEISYEQAKQAMERVGLDPKDTRIYRKYSMGMKQKLGIANAIMGEPDIIILDEPINALDEESVQRIRKVLYELRDKDKLIIIACHDKEEMECLADEIILMKEGKIVAKED